MRLLMFIGSAAFLLSCDSVENDEHVPYHELPAYNETGDVRAVIEIPAGTNQKIEFNKLNDEFEQDIKDGFPRQVEFLPYIGNYGFIPSTIVDEEKGGDGDALDILVLAESVPTGTVMLTIPIAVLELTDGGEVDNKVIAVPSDPDERILYVDSFEELRTHYPEVIEMIKTWFLNYKRNEKVEFIGWTGQQEAFSEIEKWLVREVSE